MKVKSLYLILFMAVSLMLWTMFSHGEQSPAPAKDDVFKNIQIFSDALSFVRSGYVHEVASKDLVYGALKGLLSSLDDYSQFLEPNSFEDIKVDTKGEFGGLGIEVGMRDGLLTVIAPIPGTPADIAGLKTGDVIVKINGETTKHEVVADSLKKLRGPSGEPVKITVWRESEKKTTEYTIKRAVIKVQSVKEARIIDGAVYIKLIEFQEKSSEEILRALEKLDANKSCGIVLDLRNNAGGLLDEAVNVAELFLKKDMPIVQIKGRIPEQNKEYRSTLDHGYSELPMVVIVNGGSASASEIVAGAVKDNQRGILLGEKTYGKGSVQAVIPLSDGSAIKMTTAKYYTPNNICIDKTGIVPDQVIPNIREVSVGEADVFDEADETEVKPPENDLQLKAAIGMLKVIPICGRMK